MSRADQVRRRKQRKERKWQRQNQRTRFELPEELSLSLPPHLKLLTYRISYEPLDQHDETLPPLHLLSDNGGWPTRLWLPAASRDGDAIA